MKYLLKFNLQVPVEEPNERAAELRYNEIIRCLYREVGPMVQELHFEVIETGEESEVDTKNAGTGKTF